MKQINITKQEAGTSLIKVLNKYLKAAPDSFLYKMLRKKNITLNGKKATGKEKIAEGDVIRIFFSDETYEKFAGNAQQIQKENNSFLMLRRLAEKKAYEKLPVVYEDTDILVANKPKDLLSQKATDSDISANELFLSYLVSKGELTQESFGVIKPSVANRLDRNTTGLLLFGKTVKGLQELSKALKDRNLKKYYICLVKGRVDHSMEVEGYLVKDEKSNKVTITKEPQAGGFYIKTSYEPISGNDKLTRLRVHLITGRSHQIRAHLAYLGHPILGDNKYGDRSLNRTLKQNYGVDSQLLHAHEMIFDWGLHVFAPIPEIFDTIEGESHANLEL